MSTALLTGREAATRRLARIREALVVADNLLAEAWEARDWAALGHATWADYCAQELPELRHVRVTREERDAKIAAAGAAGMTVRAIVDAYGYSLGTVHRALADVEQPATKTATDGRVRAARAAKPAQPAQPAPKLSGAARVRAALAEAGERGATTPELCRQLKLHHGTVSGELSRLAARGRAHQPRHLRGGYGVYVVVRP